MLAQRVQVARHATPPRIMRHRSRRFFIRSTVEKRFRAFQRQPEFSGGPRPWPRPRYHSQRFSELHNAGVGRIASERDLACAVVGAEGTEKQTEDDWTGYGGIGDYSNSNGNTMPVMDAGHRIRNGEFETLPANVIDTGETCDCVVVGGGISGLAAALIFQQLAGKGKNCLVIDNHPIFGGEAKRNEFLVDGHRLMAHQGSAFFPVPYPHSFIARFYDSIGLKAPRLEYQKWGGSDPEMKLSTDSVSGIGSKRHLLWSKVRQAGRHVDSRRQSLGACPHSFESAP